MGFLMGKRFYLSGPIEFAKGPNWRPDVIKVLTENFGIEVFDPHADEKEKSLPEAMEAKASGDYDTVAKIARKFVKKDLGSLDRCDALIANLERNVMTTGSCHEIINSINSKKPTILLCTAGKQHIPLWYWGIMPHQMLFGSWDAVFKYLSEVNLGKHQNDERWSYVYGIL